MPLDEIVIDVTKKSYKPFLIKVGLFIGILFILGMVAMYLPVSTRVSLEVPVTRVEWTLGLFPSQQILNPLMVESVSFQKFASLDFTASSLHVADPEQNTGGTMEAPPLTWDPVTIFGDVRFSAKNTNSHVQIQPVDPQGKSLGTLGSIRVREETNVILEVVKGIPNTIRVSILGPESSVQLTPIQPFEVITTDTDYLGLKEFPLIHKSSLVFRPELPEYRSSIEIKGTRQQLVITLRLSPSEQPHVLSEEAIPIKAIDFSRKDTSGQARSALAGPARLTYADFSKFPAKMIPVADVVQIEPSQILTIQRIALVGDNTRLLISLDGMAKSIQSVSEGVSVDHRVPLVDHLWHVFRSGVK